MKKIVLFCLFAITLFSESFILENQTSYPTDNGKSKLAVQWASSAKEVQEHNQALLQELKMNPATTQTLSKQGTLKLSFPKNSEYFRVLVWPKGKGNLEFLTNWIEIVPNKTYLLKREHLIPAVLMYGMGC